MRFWQSSCSLQEFSTINGFQFYKDSSQLDTKILENIKCRNSSEKSFRMQAFSCTALEFFRFGKWPALPSHCGRLAADSSGCSEKNWHPGLHCASNQRPCRGKH